MPLHPKTWLGPLISRTQMDRVLGYVQIGKNEGARPVLEGGRAVERGFFVGPTVFDGAFPGKVSLGEPRLNVAPGL
ncbi:MAG: aldehyde dehydrogenase family protein [Acidobacteriota bacterium]